MNILLAKTVAELESGDRIVCSEESTLHFREVHEVTDNTVLFLHGESIEFKYSTTVVMVEMEFETTEVEVIVEDTRDRSDLALAQSALDRANQHPENSEEYWSEYYGVKP